MRTSATRRRSRFVALLALLPLLLATAGCMRFTTTTGDSSTAIGLPGAAPGKGWTAAENAKAGMRNWQITHEGAAHAIEGYTDQISALPGQPVRLYVSTTASSFTATAFRMGWYRGRQAREIWHSGRQNGHAQPIPGPTPGTYMIETNWQPSLVLRTAHWPEGDYLIRLSDASGDQRYVPLVLRSRSTAGKVVIVNAVTTWEAYNAWGGYDLYQSPGSLTAPANFAHRSRIVSFDRPFEADGAALFLRDEQPLVAQAESLGLNLAYETSVDLDREPGLLAGAKAVISPGHDEYWSAGMRNEVTAALDHGTNVAFMGANEIYWQVRFTSSPLGDRRRIICFKDGAEDPLSATQPRYTTVQWREWPVSYPESLLVGVMYQCTPVNAPYVVADPSFWGFRGTGVQSGDSFAGLVGPEYDDVHPDRPPNVHVIAHSPVVCGTNQSFSDAAYYTAPSGADVFAAGTMRWVCAMELRCGVTTIDSRGQEFATAVTRNILAAFAAGPAGQTH